ncbi:helix-turn-helix domain-containing protein, partial [Streptomyces sp. NPDC001940]
MDNGKRTTGMARDKPAAELKLAYESGASIRSIELMGSKSPS